ncbi:MAG TPA: glucosaminidase domain-containing protein [Ktedonobacteraceae bacterium]|nr:glucosaminidase domain-containing protein [Ktedonobacteraceae bacterium]
MARGSSYGDNSSLPPIPVTPQSLIPRRATRELPAIQSEELETEEIISIRRTGVLPETQHYYVDEHPLTRHRIWLNPLLICMVVIVVGSLVVISAAVYQRPGPSQVVNVPTVGSFPIQLGGSVDAFNTWQNSTGPIVIKKPIPVHTGPYSVLGKPTISASFINQVLASYHSPAAGKGQTMYDLGVKYGIDPVFALAFFMHESLFGTTGEARATLSLGNSRCIPTRPCIDQDRGGYAKMYSWEDGFDQYYKLIRNLYVAQWGLVTVDQIIPRYAPNSDGNNEKEYIATLKHEIDTWRAGILRP